MLRSIPNFCNHRRPFANRILLIPANREYYSRFSSSLPKPVDLEYDVLEPPIHSGVSKGPLVILHGLLGSKRNWSSLSKAFLKDLNRTVYTLDLRNHGSSPHAHPMTYPAMASDVLHFCQSHSLSNISLLGHSMGGKVAMTLALTPDLPPTFLSRLIVADIAPSRGPLSPEFRSYFRAMSEIDSAKVTSREQAHDILKPYEPDAMVRAFILTNLISLGEEEGLKFRIPLDILTPSLPDMGDFPYEPLQRSWPGPTLVIKGSQSKYINDNNIPLMKGFFPAMQLRMLNTGHWVHSEAPNEFKELVNNFIK